MPVLHHYSKHSFSAELLLPNAVKELPSVRFVCSCSSVFLHIMMTLALYQIAKADTYEQLSSDRTSHQQTAILNVVIGFLHDSRFKTITLSISIIAEDKTAESHSKFILHIFKESEELLDTWRIIIIEMFPSCHDLIDLIPNSSDLTLSKLTKK